MLFTKVQWPLRLFYKSQTTKQTPDPDNSWTFNSATSNNYCAHALFSYCERHVPVNQVKCTHTKWLLCASMTTLELKKCYLAGQKIIFA